MLQHYFNAMAKGHLKAGVRVTGMARPAGNFASDAMLER